MPEHCTVSRSRFIEWHLVRSHKENLSVLDRQRQRALSPFYPDRERLPRYKAGVPVVKKI